MKTAERIVIYAALGLLAAANLPRLLESAGPPAFAAAPASDRVGPYASVALSQESEDDLVLRARGGRLAWDDSDYARAMSFAFMHVGNALGPLLETDHFVEERQRLEDEIREIDEDLVARMEAFREAHIGDDPSVPEEEEVRAQREALVREYEAWTQERTRLLGALAARQIEEAYREVIAAVEVVADRLGIDVVLRFIPTANDFQSLNSGQAYVSVRARIALKYPEALDITDEVLEELALDVE